MSKVLMILNMKVLKSDDIKDVVDDLSKLLYKKSNGFKRLWENIRGTAKGENVWGRKKRGNKNG